MNQPTKRRTLYPRIDPFDQGYLRVSDVHTIHYEQCGNPFGQPVVVLHGGPGAARNRTTVAISIPHTTVSCCLTSADAA